VVTAGVPRFVGRSRNTPATARQARVAVSRITQDFAAAAH
jgi:enamidase